MGGGGEGGGIFDWALRDCDGLNRLYDMVQVCNLLAVKTHHHYLQKQDMRNIYQKILIYSTMQYLPKYIPI